MNKYYNTFNEYDFVVYFVSQYTKLNIEWLIANTKHYTTDINGRSSGNSSLYLKNINVNNGNTFVSPTYLKVNSESISSYHLINNILVS